MWVLSSESVALSGLSLFDACGAAPPETFNNPTNHLKPMLAYVKLHWLSGCIPIGSWRFGFNVFKDRTIMLDFYRMIPLKPYEWAVTHWHKASLNWLKTK